MPRSVFPADLRSRRRTAILVLPTALAGVVVLAACSADSSARAPQATGQSAASTVSSPATADASNSPNEGVGPVEPTRAKPSGGTADGAVSHVVASDAGVRVKDPRRRPSGNGMWVAVDVTNLGKDAASYRVVILVSGSEGFSATVRTQTDVLAPGREASQSCTALGSPGVPTPEHAKVSIISVTRTPA